MAGASHERGTVFGRDEESAGAGDIVGVGDCGDEVGVGGGVFGGCWGVGVVEGV